MCGGSPVLLELVKLDAVASGTAGTLWMALADGVNYFLECCWRSGSRDGLTEVFTYMTCFGKGSNVSNQPGRQSI